MLRNVYDPHLGDDPDSDVASEMDLDHEEDSYTPHLKLRPFDALIPAKKVSLLVEIEGEAILGIGKASSILRIADDLDPQKTYKLRVTHMGCMYWHGGSYEEILEFEGLWLDRPAAPAGITRTANTTMPATLGTLLPNDQGHVYVEHDGYSIPSAKKQVIELVTSEHVPDSDRMNEWYTEDSDSDIADDVEARVVSWYNMLGSQLSADVAIVPLGGSTLMPIEAGQDGTETTAKDVFFRSGPQATARFFSRPWSFASYQPAVLILQIGLVDFVKFLSEKKNVNKHAMIKFTNEFVESYVKFVHTIRSNAYTFQESAASALFGASSDDGSYIYNSAPSTLPIFLITPFSSRRRYMTKKLTLHKLISDALAQVATRLQAEGDKSTHLIDTTGWLDPKADFQAWEAKFVRNDGPEANLLTPEAKAKIASRLADHLCPYLKKQAATDPSGFRRLRIRSV